MAVQVASTISFVLIIMGLVQGYKKRGHKFWLTALLVFILDMAVVVLIGSWFGIQPRDLGRLSMMTLGPVLWTISYAIKPTNQQKKRKTTHFG